MAVHVVMVMMIAMRRSSMVVAVGDGGNEQVAVVNEGQE